MSKEKESVQDRLARMKREKEEAKDAAPAKLVEQLNHDNDASQDFTELAKRLEERKKKEAKGENDEHVKMTIYVRKDIAQAFNALITKRGQQKTFVNQALSDFVQKKTRELGLDK